MLITASTPCALENFPITGVGIRVYPGLMHALACVKQACAVIIAFFEYMFYWCTILVIAKLIDWARSRLAHPIP